MGEVPVSVSRGWDDGDVRLSRELTDRLLTADDDLRGIDGERFHLDLSEIIDEASKIASLADAAQDGTASELLADLSGSMAHLMSHWQRLAKDTDWADIHKELLKTYRSVNDERKPWWRRLRRAV